MSAIEWTQETWNPIAGCSKVSPGCTNCYAEVMAGRLEAMGQEKYRGLTVLQGSHRVWTGKPQHTFQMLTKRAERMQRYMSDNNPRYTIRKIFDEAEKIDPVNGYRFDCDIYKPLDNVWLGVSVERQKEADERIPLLLQTPAAVRFISAEPLLGELDLRVWLKRLPLKAGSAKLVAGTSYEIAERIIDWVIVGGESGLGARPCNVEWIRSIVQQCQAADVPVFVKQMGTKPHDSLMRALSYPEETKYILGSKTDPKDKLYLPRFKNRKGGDPSEWPEDLRVRHMPEVRA
jgi:protein gp37